MQRRENSDYRLRVNQSYNMLKKTKIVIIGAGNVGASVAFDLMISSSCDNIVLIDQNKELAYAQALDLRHCALYLEKPISITEGDYSDCADADILILSAAAPLIKGQTRLDMLASAYGIVQNIVPKVMDSGFSGCIIVITNPVDVISYCVYKLSGLPKNKVIGTGTALDTARLKLYIANIMKTDLDSIQIVSIGEHGDSLVIPWSVASFNGNKLTDLLFRKNPDNERKDQLDSIHNMVINAGWEVADIKNTTNYGIAAVTTDIVKTILQDKNKIIPISAFLDGEFGVKDVYAGVPAIVNANGVTEIVDFEMTQEEHIKFLESIAIIKQSIKSISIK